MGELLNATIHHANCSSEHTALNCALGTLSMNQVCTDRLYWGSVENFAGLERAAVVITGFLHPLYLVHKHEQAGGLKPEESAVDQLVYLGATRSTCLLSVVDVGVKEFMEHYAIRDSNDGL